jgi:hypothetical protein
MQVKLTGYSLPSWDVIAAATRLFLDAYNCQPLPLFSPSHLSENLSSRDPELLLAILALAGHSTGNRSQIAPEELIHFKEKYAERAVELVMKRVFQGPVELSTIQTLCLLSLLSFNGESLQALSYRNLIVAQTGTLQRPASMAHWRWSSASQPVSHPRIPGACPTPSQKSGAVVTGVSSSSIICMVVRQGIFAS